MHPTARPSLLGAALLTATLLTACTAAPAPDPTSTAAYTPPAWMAQAAESAERQAVIMRSCLEEAGVGASAFADGGSLSISSKLGPDDLTEDETKARAASESKTVERCLKELQSTFPVTEESNEVRYDKMVQTAECVRANGYPEVGQPPSKDTWVETYDDMNVDPWNPYRELHRLHPDITEDAWRSLRAICAQGGVSYSLNF